MLVSTNSALMQLVPSPADHPACSPVWSVIDALDEAAFRLLGRAVFVNHFANRLTHQAGHRDISRGGIDAEAPEQGLGETECHVLVRPFHKFHRITEMCDPHLTQYLRTTAAACRT